LAGGGDLGNDVLERGGAGFDGSGAGGVADCAEAHGFGDRLVFREKGHEDRDGGACAAPLEDLAFVGEVKRRQGDFLLLEIHPDVHFGEVREGEDAEVFAVLFAPVEQIPEFRALVFWIPLAEAVPVGKEALLGAGLFLVAAPAAEAGVEAVCLDGIKQGDRLQGVARGVGAGFFADPARADAFLDRPYHKAGLQVVPEAVPVFECFREIVAGINVQKGHGEPARPDRLGRDVGQNDRILAAGKKQGGLIELGEGFADDEYGLRFELVEMVEFVIRHGMGRQPCARRRAAR